MKDIIMAALASGAVFSFVQFIITFGFSRADKTQEIEKKVVALDDKIDKNQAGVEHSAEYFRQQLDDCDTYEKYCETHPEFKNSYTMIANKNIKETFERLTREGKL